MEKILVIEDNTDVRESVCEIFKESGYDVIEAQDGKRGLEYAKAYEPDLIICDLTMPGIDGFEVKEYLSMDKKTLGIPFICLTARKDINDVQRALELGADDYILKPFRAPKLLELVSKRLQRIKELKRTTDVVIEKKSVFAEDKKILLKSDEEHILTLLNDIIIIKALNDNSEVFLKCMKKTLVKKSLKSWEEILPEKIFLRVHRNMIINTNYIEKIEPMFKGSYAAKMKIYPDIIYFSQRYSQKIRKMLLIK